MDGKVILTIFGVVLLLAAIFFFFKSFSSHEQRMQEEQAMRLQLEREKLAAGQVPSRPLTPEELEQRRKLEEARLKVEQARKAAADAARAEAERKRLEQQAALQKQRAEEEKKRAEDARLAEEIRLKQLAEANRLAEEERAKAEAEAKARLEQERKRVAAAVLADLAAWQDNVLQQAATAYPVKVQPPVLMMGTHNYVFTNSNASGTGGVSTSYNSPDEVPGFAGWSEGAVVSLCKLAMAEDAARQDPVVRPPDVFGRIEVIEDADALKEIHRKLTAQIFKAQDSGASAGKNQAACRNLISMGLRQMDKLEKQEAELLRGTGGDAMNPRAVGGPVGPSRSQLLEGVQADKRKTVEKLRTQVVSYWKAMNEVRGTTAAAKLLTEAKRLAAARLGILGVTDLGAATVTAPASKDAAAYKIYVLNDGTEIKAYTVVKMGDQLAIKDETGELKTVQAADVKEIRKP